MPPTIAAAHLSRARRHEARRHMWVLAAALAVLWTAPARADFQAGIEAYKKGEYGTAISEWLVDAAEENPRALFNLAQMYRLGVGVEQDINLAEQYYRRAALRGHVGAQANLGSMYFERDPPQAAEAIYFWRHAARGGDARSQYLLGVQYFNADYVVQDYVLAYAWVSLAADAGLAEAKQALGVMAEYLEPGQVQEGRKLAANLMTEDSAIAQATRDLPETETASRTAASAPPAAAGQPKTQKKAEPATTAPPVAIQSAGLPVISGRARPDRPPEQQASATPPAPTPRPEEPAAEDPEQRPDENASEDQPVTVAAAEPPTAPAPPMEDSTADPVAAPAPSPEPPVELTAVEPAPASEPVPEAVPEPAAPAEPEPSAADTPAPPAPTEIARGEVEKPGRDATGLPEILVAANPGNAVFRAQFASLKTEADAETIRRQLLDRHGDVLEQLDLQIEQADLGPELGTFYRVKSAPLVSHSTSEAVCAVMAKRDVSCLPVKSINIVAHTPAPRKPVQVADAVLEPAPGTEPPVRPEPEPAPAKISPKPVAAEPAKVAAVDPKPVPAEIPAPTAEEEPVPMGGPIEPDTETSGPDPLTAPDLYRVQVAAHRSDAEARAHWDRLTRQHGDLFRSVDLYIYEIDLAARGTYFRVQLGPFGEKGSASAFCGTLKEHKVDCFVVKSPA